MTRTRGIALTVAFLGLLLSGLAWSQATPPAPPAEPPKPPARSGVVTVLAPTGPPTVETGKTDRAGQPIRVACSTCHATPSALPVQSSGGLAFFHVGLQVKHGQLTCLSCHNSENMDLLRRADGQPITYPHVMDLCGQCHGPQRRDYDHGSHGGMTGYWDLSRGDRLRKNCLHCHDPHAPAYPQVLPVFRPLERSRSR